jgi:hypothetical protein
LICLFIVFELFLGWAAELLLGELSKVVKKACSTLCFKFSCVIFSLLWIECDIFLSIILLKCARCLSDPILKDRLFQNLAPLHSVVSPLPLLESLSILYFHRQRKWWRRRLLLLIVCPDLWLWSFLPLLSNM